MNLPRMNPVTARLLGGREFREQLRERLLTMAAETHDPAYRQRLNEVAEGKRPLRTLMHDPRFLSSMPDVPSHPPSDIATQDDIEQVRERVNQHLREQELARPTAEEYQAIAEEAREMQRDAEAITRADELNGWGGSLEQMAREEKTVREPRQGQADS